MDKKNTKIELYKLLQPHLLTVSELSSVLEDRCVKTNCSSKEKLVELFKHVALPLPQREYPPTTRGKMLNKLRRKLQNVVRLEDSCKEKQTFTVGVVNEAKRPTSIAVKERLKPPPCSSANKSTALPEIKNNSSNKISLRLRTSNCDFVIINKKRGENKSTKTADEVSSSTEVNGTIASTYVAAKDRLKPPPCLTVNRPTALPEMTKVGSKNIKLRLCASHVDCNVIKATVNPEMGENKSTETAEEGSSPSSRTSPMDYVSTSNEITLNSPTNQRLEENKSTKTTEEEICIISSTTPKACSSTSKKITLKRSHLCLNVDSGKSDNEKSDVVEKKKKVITWP